MYPWVRCSTTYNGQDTEATRVPTGRLVDREEVVHHTTEHYPAMKQDGLTTCNITDGPSGYCAK